MQAVGPELVAAGDVRSPFHHVQSDLTDRSLFGRLQEAVFDPLVEGSHRRATPDLVVQDPVTIALERPTARLPEIPFKDPRHLVPGILFGAFDFFGPPVGRRVGKIRGG